MESDVTTTTLGGLFKRFIEDLGSKYTVVDYEPVARCDDGTSTTIELEVNGEQYFVDIYKVENEEEDESPTEKNSPAG